MGFLAAALEARTARLGPSLHPAKLDDPRVIFGDMLGQDHSGMNLSEREVLGWPAVLQACRLISWSIGMTPCQLFEETDRGARKLKAAEGHPVHWILHDEPHPEYTPFEWKADIAFNSVFRGAWYGQKVSDQGARLRSVFPLDTHRMESVGRRRARLRFQYREEGGKRRVFYDEELLRVNGFRDGGIIGLALRELSATTFGKGVAMDRYGAKLFKNGMGATTVVEQDKDSTFKFPDTEEQQRFFDRLADTLAGEKNWHRTVGLPSGMTMKTMGISAKEAQLIEGLTFQVQDVSRLTGVPPSLLMDLSRGTFSNVEQQMLQFFKLVLGPWFVNLEQRFMKSLLTAEERRRYVIKFNPDALLRTTLKERYDAYRVGVGRPWMSPNEVRDLENMEPLADGGDEVMLPLNMLDPGGDPGTSGDGGEPEAPPQDGDADTRSQRDTRAPAAGTPEVDCGCRYCREDARTATGGARDGKSGDSQPLVPRGGTGPAGAGRKARFSDRMAELRQRSVGRRRLRKAFRGTIEREASRLVRAEIREIKKIFKGAGVDLSEAGRSGLKSGDSQPLVPRGGSPRFSEVDPESRADEALLSALESWFEDGFTGAFDRTLRGVVQDYAVAMADAAAEQAGGDPGAVDMGAFIDEYVNALAERIGGQHLGQIRKLVKESGADELGNLVRERLEEWDQGREDGSRMSQSEKIAAWESVRAGEAVARETWRQVGVEELEWVTDADPCPLCESLGGQVVGIERVFVEASGEVDPGDESPPLRVNHAVGHAPLHGGCECEVAPAG